MNYRIKVIYKKGEEVISKDTYLVRNTTRDESLRSVLFSYFPCDSNLDFVVDVEEING